MDRINGIIEDPFEVELKSWREVKSRKKRLYLIGLVQFGLLLAIFFAFFISSLTSFFISVGTFLATLFLFRRKIVFW